MSKERTKDLLLLFAMSLTVSLIAFYSHFVTGDTKTFKKSIVFDSYYYAGDGYKTKSNFYLKSEEAKYIISSTIFPVFNYDQFKNNISKGDTLDLVIDKSRNVFEISSKTKTYLEMKNSVNIYKKNKFIGLIVGAFFAILSVFILVLIFRW